MAPTISRSVSSLISERVRILDRIGLSLEEFRTAVRSRPLTSSEWLAREELEEIEFLLGDSDLDD